METEQKIEILDQLEEEEMAKGGLLRRLQPEVVGMTNVVIAHKQTTIPEEHQEQEKTEISTTLYATIAIDTDTFCIIVQKLIKRVRAIRRVQLNSVTPYSSAEGHE